MPKVTAVIRIWRPKFLFGVTSVIKKCSAWGGWSRGNREERQEAVRPTQLVKISWISRLIRQRYNRFIMYLDTACTSRTCEFGQSDCSFSLDCNLPSVQSGEPPPPPPRPAMQPETGFNESLHRGLSRYTNPVLQSCHSHAIPFDALNCR